MFIKQIRIRKYRHIENLEVGQFLTPSDSSDLIVFAGPNGGGKSSVLELISQALGLLPNRRLKCALGYFRVR